MAAFYKRLLRQLGFRRADIRLFTLQQRPASPLQMDEQVYRLLDAADFARDPIFAEKNRRATYIARLAAGHRCHGHVGDDGAVASYQWISDGRIDAPFEAGLQLDVPAGHRYIWDCRTAAWAAGRGLYRHALQTLAAETASVKWIICEVGNAASARGILNAGFEPAGNLQIICAGPFCLLQDGQETVVCRSVTPLAFRHWGHAPQA